MVDLPGQGKAPELKCRTQVLFEDLPRRGVDVTVRTFTADEGADGHCELNNLRLVVFDWLDRAFGNPAPDLRRIG